MTTPIHAPQASAPPTNSQQQPQILQGAFRSLIEEIQRAVLIEGYVAPTPIQEQCIPCLLEGRDLLGCAQTGTGKTAAFSLPLLQRLMENPRSRRSGRGAPRALLLAPTRELAAQIEESIRTYGRFLPLGQAVIFGGVSQFHQVKALEKGIDILVATPGRLLDLMQQGYVRLDKVEFFVLDEVDRMLDMGFIHDITRILAKVPAERQTALFSATMPARMMELAHRILRDPVGVSIAPEKPAVERIVQKVLFVGKQNKDALLASVLADPGITKAIVFTRMKHAANKVVKKLAGTGVSGAALHGNKSQAARTKALEGFKRGQYRVLVATDVAARGLDVDDISHVINYDLPGEAETYVHRIGRTARAGTGGDAISFCCAEERAHLREIENLLGKPVPADTEHALHCEEARRSTQPVPNRSGGARRDGRSFGNSAPRRQQSRRRR